MPSACVHLKVAYLLKNELNIKNHQEFYLGTISPDAVNLQGFASQEVRYAAHIRDKNYDIWKNNIVDFYNKNKSNYSDSFEFPIGFLTHIYTDIAWDELVQPQLFEYLSSKGCSSEDLTQKKWEELFRFNSQICKENWYDGVLKSLKQAKCYDISSVSKDLLNEYRNYLVEDYQEKFDNKPAHFLSDDMVNVTSKKVLEYMTNLVK